MEPISGVEIHKCDITSDEFITKMKECEIETVICDGAPDVTGYYEIDLHAQIGLLISALTIAVSVHGNSTSTFVSKIFKGNLTKYVTNHFRKYYKRVLLTKPRASRAESDEAFVICTDLYNCDITNVSEIDYSLNLENEPLEVCGYDNEYFIEEYNPK
ncbi:TRM71 [Enterospora canceri]|uniref:TRM71 n=1 Tax=Enterospora canceri TaxID=1081671 RepID=A0A1Y1S6E4_9MICR|nr:TRM71 [Enterospora canceri]